MNITTTIVTDFLYVNNYECGNSEVIPNILNVVRICTSGNNAQKCSSTLYIY